MKLMHKGAVLAALAGGLILVGGGVAAADSDATGAAVGSPGVLSGNLIQVPVDVPVNACGNSLNVLALLNPAFGNSCSNGGHGTGIQSHNTGDDKEGRNHSVGGASHHMAGAVHHLKDEHCK